MDTGAYDNLAGLDWCLRVAAHAASAGHGCEWQAIKPLSIDGVGKDANACTRKLKVPIALTADNNDFLMSTFEAPVVEETKGRQLPALLGIRSMKQQRVLLDTIHNKYIIVGPGGFQLQLSPGSRILTMRETRSGHLLLPCTNWNASPNGGRSQTRTPQSQKLIFSSSDGIDPVQYQ